MFIATIQLNSIGIEFYALFRIFFIIQITQKQLINNKQKNQSPIKKGCFVFNRSKEIKPIN